MSDIFLVWALVSGVLDGIDRVCKSICIECLSSNLVFENWKGVLWM